MIDYTSHREFVRKVLDREVDYTAEGHRTGPRAIQRRCAIRRIP